MKYIMPFMAIVFLIMCAFSFAARWLFGQRIDEFHTLMGTGGTFVNLILALMDGFDFEEMKDAAPMGAPVWALSFTVISCLVLLNMFIAILSDSYASVQDRISKQEEFESNY